MYTSLSLYIYILYIYIIYIYIHIHICIYIYIYTKAVAAYEALRQKMDGSRMAMASTGFAAATRTAAKYEA